MHLYLREKQLELFERIFDTVEPVSNFVLLHGKQKVGKTALVAEHLRRRPGVYIALNGNPAALHPSDAAQQFRKAYRFDSELPAFTSLQSMIEFAFYATKDQRINLAVNNFHLIEEIEPALIHELPVLWNKYRLSSLLNFIAVTDNESFINRMFTGPNAPFATVDHLRVKLTPFRLPEIAALMQMNDTALALDEIVKIYFIFGGLPKYYELIEQFNLWNADVIEIMNVLVFSKRAPLADEMYARVRKLQKCLSPLHVRLLQLIASGTGSPALLADQTGSDQERMYAALDELEQFDRIIKKKNSMRVDLVPDYVINDYFENFWFRFIQPENGQIEKRRLNELHTAVKKELPSYFHLRSFLLIKELLNSNDLLKTDHTQNVTLHELLSLVKYRPRRLRTVRAQSSRVRKLEPVQKLVFHQELK